MSGYLGDLSSAQEEALRKLQAAVSDLERERKLPETDDYFYLRWLRARKFNVKKAEQSIRKHIEFRECFGLDTVLTDWQPPEVLSKFTPGGFFGEDREGHPVWFDCMGNLDFRGFHRSARKEDIFKFKAYHLEKTVQVLKDCSAKHGRHIETVVSIIDLENLSYQRHYYWPGITIFRELLSMFEANYPERTKRVIVVRAPKAFPVAYNLIKPFMDEVTRNKIIVLGSNWKEELQKYISPDQLPQAYGGTRCEPDPYCTDFISIGGDIPEKYYMTNLTETSREEMERVVIGRGSTCELEFHISHPRTVLSWEFVSTDYDISFGWFTKEIKTRKLKSSKILKEIVPTQRANSHIVPEAGAHECAFVGTYILKFDNSYSWARSKEIFYSVKVSAPSVLHREPHPLPVVQQQEEEAGSPHPHQSTCPAPSSSEDDEFHDCVQEVEITTCTQEAETIISRVQDSSPPSPNQSITTTVDAHEQALTGTSVSTQV